MNASHFIFSAMMNGSRHSCNSSFIDFILKEINGTICSALLYTIKCFNLAPRSGPCHRWQGPDLICPPLRGNMRLPTCTFHTCWTLPYSFFNLLFGSWGWAMHTLVTKNHAYVGHSLCLASTVLQYTFQDFFFFEIKYTCQDW